MTPKRTLVLDDLAWQQPSETLDVKPLSLFDPEHPGVLLSSYSVIELNARDGTFVRAQTMADRLRELTPKTTVKVAMRELPVYRAERSKDDHATIANHFFLQHGWEILWLRDMERWAVWEDHRWQGVTDRTGQQLARGRLLTTLYHHALTRGREIYDAARIADGGTKDKAYAAALKFEERMRSAGTQHAVWDVVNSSVGLSPVSTTLDKLNPDPWRCNAPNGVIDLQTGTLTQHDPRFRCTEMLGAEYLPAAYDPALPEGEEPTFLRFLREAQPDPEVRRYLQRRAGSFLVGQQREHVLHVDLGARGRNGKSTFNEALRMAMGSYAVVTDARILLVSPTDRHETEKARLVHKRWVLVEEARSRRMLDAATTKNLTGGVRRKARFMRQDEFEYTPSDSWLLVTNEMPRFTGSDEALGARLLIVPWTVSFAGREDIELLEKIRDEIEVVLAWMVAGAVEYHKHGLNPPAVVRTATEEERREHDPLGDWLEEHLEAATEPDEFAHVATMYAHCSDLFRERRILDDLPSYIEFGRQLARYVRSTGWAVESKQRTVPTHGRSAAWTGVKYTASSWMPDPSWMASLHTS